MDKTWRLLEKGYIWVKAHELIILAIVGLGMARVVLAWALSADASESLPIAHALIDLGQLISYLLLSAYVISRGILRERGLLIAVSAGVLLAAVAVYCCSLAPFMIAIACFLGGMAAATLTVLWLEVCGCMTPRQMVVAVSGSYLVSGILWPIQSLLTGNTASAMFTTLAGLLSSVFLVPAFILIPPDHRLRWLELHSKKTKTLHLSPRLLSWVALMSLSYGLGDSLTRMGHTTMASKVGMTLPFVAITLALIFDRDMIDLRRISTWTEILMGVGVASFFVPAVLPQVSQFLMSSAQAGYVVVACAIACVSAFGRKESSAFGCGIVLSVILVFAQAGLLLGSNFGLLAPVPEQAAVSVVCLTALVCVGVSAVLIAKEDLSSLVETILGEQGANDWQVAQESAEDRPQAGETSVGFTFTAGEVERRLLRKAQAAGLSKRETAVFLRVARGDNTQKIASDLFIAMGTVRSHESRIYDKFGVHSREELSQIL